jgi:Ser/Thr protein kinase RdoA (MazF antagonist)
MDSIIQILRNWNLENAAITAIDSPSQTAWDIDGRYVLKRYRNSDEAQRGIQLAELLHAEGIPVIRYIADKNGQLFSPDELCCLMMKLPGRHVDFFEEPQTASAMGAELAKLHIALARIEQGVSCYDVDLFTEWRELFIPSVRGLLADSIIDKVDSRFQAVYPSLPRQLIHRDVHPQNVLFDGGKITGWLDFDIGQKNVRLFDLAYFLSGLLIGNTNDPDKIKVWHTIYRNLVAGYDEVNILSREERDALPILMIVIECLFCWWNKQNGDTEQLEVSIGLSKWLINEFIEREENT